MCSGTRGRAVFRLSFHGGAGIWTIEAFVTRGLPFGDLDNDGSLEIVVVDLFELSLLKNFGECEGMALLVRQSLHPDAMPSERDINGNLPGTR